MTIHRTDILKLSSDLIPNLWPIETPALVDIIYRRPWGAEPWDTRMYPEKHQNDLEYRISHHPNHPLQTEAVFYMNGYGGHVDDTPFLEDFVCDHMPLIRVQSLQLKDPLQGILKGTFGDACALLHNACRKLMALADHLGLTSYSVIGHSWGGLISLLAGYDDPRCGKTMQLASSPDICDVVSRLYLMWNAPIPGLPVIAQIVVRKLIVEAEKAKSGGSRNQDAWEAISPWSRQPQPGFKLLVFNREDDPIMRKPNMEHFIAHTQARGVSGMSAEFVPHTGRGTQDMPLDEFSSRMRGFLFGAN